MKNTALLIFAATCLLLATAYAQEPDPAYSRSVVVPGVSTAVTVYTGAPSGFDPVTASPEELQTYGYPRRPDPSDAKAYSLWKRAVDTTRITPELQVVPGRYHMPNQRVQTFSGVDNATVKNTTSSSSGNWSGYSLVNGSPKFDEIVGSWIVPNVNSQFESFTGYSSMWVGIDGNCKCNDLIQDGTEQDWLNGKTVYDAWIEFIPEAEMKINNFTVQPGDAIYAYSQVVVKSTGTYGVYYIANYNTRKSFSGSLLMPKGDVYSGQSAEWIVERTQVNGSFQSPMPDYAYAYMDDAFAYRSGSSQAIGFLAEPNENITMVDPSGKKLSRSYAQDSDSMWFQWLAY